MIPPFTIEGGVGLAAARALSVAGLMAAFGATLFPALLAPPGLSTRTHRRLDCLAWASLAAALSGALLWLVMQTADLAGSISLGDLRAVLADTQFGHLLACRVVLLGLAACALAVRQRTVATCLAAGALVLQAGHSHAQAMYGPGWLLLSSALHLLAGGAWLGSLVPLLVVCGSESPEVVRRAARCFSPVGVVCVAVLVVTATVQSRAWIGDLPGLLGTAYGWVAMLKIGLLVVLVLLAVHNRHLHAKPAGAFAHVEQTTLARSIAVETGVGMTLVLAAGVLAELPPSMHVQAMWPLAWTVSWAAVREDRDYRTEAIVTASAIVLAMGLLALGLVMLSKRGRTRLAGGLVGMAAMGVAATAASHLAPLFVPAVPTEYFRSPTGYGARSIADGEPLYRRHCAVCHGTEGHGDGPAAHGMALPPADLTAAHLFMHTDGQLFWWIDHGMDGPDGRLAMPGFATLSEDDTWALIDFLRARNTGLATRGDGRTVPIAAPDFPLVCKDRHETLSARHGQIVELVFGQGAALPGAFTVVVSLGGASTREACIAEPGQVADITRAYAIAAGQSDLSGGGALIDSNGWLRKAWRADRQPNTTSLRTLIESIAAHPLPTGAARAGDTMTAGMKMD